MLTEQQDRNYHTGRLLILIDAFSDQADGIVGLTKLAKLDFLLRYPAFLDDLLQTDGVVWPAGLEPTPVERIAVESRMMRYKYGPWDHRYYGVVGELIGKGLVRNVLRGTSSAFKTTTAGSPHARQLARTSEWRTVAGRAVLLRRRFNLSGRTLAHRIYRELPETAETAHRQLI
jgi:hypothetical protein